MGYPMSLRTESDSIGSVDGNGSDYTFIICLESEDFPPFGCICVELSTVSGSSGILVVSRNIGDFHANGKTRRGLQSVVSSAFHLGYAP